MKDIIGDVVRELESSKVLKCGWNRDCPSDRSERALIEVWVAATTKFRDKYVADVSRLETTVTELSTKLAAASGTIAKQSEELRGIAAQKVEVGIGRHIEKLGDSIGIAEAEQLKLDVA